MEESSGVWDRVVGQLWSWWLTSKTESSRQLSSHGAPLGSGVDALTITDPHLCRFKSSSDWRTDICLARALSRKLGPLLSGGALAERFLLVLLNIRIECSKSWFSTFIEPDRTSCSISSSPEDLNCRHFVPGSINNLWSVGEVQGRL